MVCSSVPQQCILVSIGIADGLVSAESQAMIVKKYKTALKLKPKGQVVYSLQ